MTDPLLIPCPHCNGLNRIPAARVGDAPKCGRCKGAVLLNKPFELKQGDYASQIKGDLPLLVDVWADWCGPCKSFAPIFEQAASQLSGRCRLAKLDSEANPQLAAQLGIRSIPSLILFKKWPRSRTPKRRLPTPALAGVAAQSGDLSVFFQQRMQFNELLGQLVPWFQMDQRQVGLMRLAHLH